MADPARDEPDEHFARLRLGELDVLDLEWGAELAEDCGLDAHGPIIVESMARDPTRSPHCATTYPISRRWSHRRTTSSPTSERAELRARSPYNVVHLTLPDSEEQAARDLAAWREAGVLVEDEEPSYWWLAQRVRRSRRCRADARGLRRRAARRAVRRARRSPARAHARRAEGGAAAAAARDAHAPRADLSPLGRVDRDRRSRRARPRRRRERRHARLWRLDAEFGAALTEELKDAQLLIADGHHRYETALAFHDEDGTEASAWLLAVIVPTDQEGLTIFPTHRIAQSVDGVERHADRPSGR